MSEIMENGDIYFFYRTKIDTKKAVSIKDIQRLFMILVPDNSDKSRMIVVGKKRLPEVSKEKSHSTGKDWCMVLSVDKPEKIGSELRPVEYETSTKGTRKEGEAIPAAEGRYSLITKDDNSRLVYKIKQPDKFGKPQMELGILPEASYVISVKNPSVKTSGFPDEKPNYPKAIKKQFADERWLPIKSPRFLNYEDVQLLLVGANDSLKEEQVKVTGNPSLFKKLGLDKKKWPLKSLTQGEFDEVTRDPEAIQSESDRTKGGRRGGIEGAKTASAAGVAKSLKGISFPKNRSDLVDFAKGHHANAEVVDLLQHLPKRKFKTMADVQKAVGEVRL